MRKRRSRSRPEMLTRRVDVTSIRARIGLHVMTERGCEPEIDSTPWLEVRGNMDEPVGAVREIVINTFPRDVIEVGHACPSSVGAIIQVRPKIDVVVPFRAADFPQLWALALSGQLKYADITFTKPHYRRAFVINVSFSNELEE